MQIDITPIILAVIGLVSSICTYFIVPLIKSKLTETQWKRLQDLIIVGVAAAEQLANTGVISKDARKEYVLNAVNSSGILDVMKKYGITVDLDQICDMIESSVYGLPNKIANSEVKKIAEQKVALMAHTAVEQKIETEIVPKVTKSIQSAVEVAVNDAIDSKIDSITKEVDKAMSADDDTCGNKVPDEDLYI